MGNFGCSKVPFFDKHTKEPWNSAVQKFARDILNDPNLNVRKVNLPFSLPMIANYNSIDIHDDIDSHINAIILQQKNASDPLKFDQRDKYATMEIVIDNSNIETYKGMLHHEYAHIKNNDTQRFAACAAISPFLTHLASNVVFKKKPTTVVRTLLRIPTGFAKLGANLALLILYIKHREQKADDAIPNDPSILKNQRNYWQALHEAEIQDFHNFDLKGKCEYTLIKIIDPHPSHTKRAQRFQQRLDKLEKENK